MRGAVLLVSALLVGCAEPAMEVAAGARGATAVTVETLAERPWQDRIEALGTAKASESVTLTAKVTETVVRVNFQDGDVVEAGRWLVDLSGKAEIAALEEAQAAYTEALQQYQRQADLVKQGILSKSTLDSLVASRDAALARTNAIRARLADRVITAPFAGVLGFRQVSPGTLVTPGTPITTLDAIDTIKLDFTVPEVAMAAVEPGQRIAAKSAAFRQRDFAGEVSVVSTRVDPVTRSVQVRAEVPNPERLLRPGMLLTVTLELPVRDVLSIPEISLIQVGSSQSVFRVDSDDTAERVEVKTGARQLGRVEILSGLQAGDQVVVDGVVKLRAGTPVSVIEPSAQIAGSAAG
ncbi:efflux RND transporter periplasmic adaptor subunit [Pseudomarimonas arenosa]|uniref:Efflux RND transporter periplasmic adaptor subunit n=1 Tax=Pseudomarimonas arenosa TaxID=2774145 RepID=A0AAW3ZD16_9GAMM|nr:efflux RND transporter periplasmic adaptor subunit [Pseudomarimonas arenosa]MBD8524203.1 efflux RND transporter periplasmic adaptor subunit [Pseudomarimonas arenosa]